MRQTSCSPLSTTPRSPRMAEPILVIDLEAPFKGYESVDEWWMSGG
jgi:hypothetical protein